MWPNPVVEVEELGQERDPVRGVVEGSRIGPLLEQRAHHALGLAVGLGPVGSGEPVADAQLVAGRGELAAPVAAAVVGEDPLDRDPVARVEAPGSPEEGRRGLRALIGQLLHVGQPRVVVDRDVHPVPADAPEPVLEARLTAMDAVASALADPPQHLGVEMDELARALALVAHDRRPGLEPVEAAQAAPAQERVDRRAGEPGLPGEDVRPRVELEPAGTDRIDERDGMGTRLAVDGAAPVDEPCLTLPAEPADPLRAGLAADPRGIGRLRDRPAVPDAVDEELPTLRGQAGTRMGHEGPFFDCGFHTSSRTIGALSPSTT